MSDFTTVGEILDFAIGAEERAYNLYMSLHNLSDSPAAKKALKEFADEELKHKAILQGFKAKDIPEPAQAKKVDLKLAEYLVDIGAEADLTYQEALVIGMKSEKAAYDLYTKLADEVDDENLRQTLLVIADEEIKHKEKFEAEYEQYVLKEN